MFLSSSYSGHHHNGNSADYLVPFGQTNHVKPLPLASPLATAQVKNYQEQRRQRLQRLHRQHQSLDSAYYESSPFKPPSLQLQPASSLVRSGFRSGGSAARGMHPGGGGGYGGGGVYAGGRVPHPHPFLRSSSVPEQPDLPPAALDHDFLTHPASLDLFPTSSSTPFPGHDQTTSSGLRNRYAYLSNNGFSYPASSSRHSAPTSSSSLGWRSTSSYLDTGGPSSGLRNNRLGRQFSLSSDFNQTSRYGNPYLSHVRDPLMRLDRDPLSHSAVSSTSSATSRSPLTLGRSLQLVTSTSSVTGDDFCSDDFLHGGGGSTNSADYFGQRRKKTVRFNSEEWGNGSAAAVAAAAAAASLNLGCDIDEDLWMTVDDVRSGRWARWDALRQESQESQTRDSGIETGSCFTSSEDSNRGDLSHKKVERKEALFITACSH